MPRQYKIEIADGVNYEFYLYEDDRIELMSGIAPISLVHYQQTLEHSKKMADLMRTTGITRFEVTRI